MSDHRYRLEVEILSVTDTGRGRVAEAARRHDVGRALLVRWRRQYREGQLTADDARPQFMSLTLAAPKAPRVPCMPSVSEPPPAPAQTQMAEITLANGRRLSVTATIDPAVLARLVQALDPA